MLTIMVVIMMIQVLPRYIDPLTSSPSSLEAAESGRAILKPCAVVHLSWSADHRVIDGAIVALFSNEVKLLLESPYMMMHHMK